MLEFGGTNIFSEGNPAIINFARISEDGVDTSLPQISVFEAKKHKKSQKDNDTPKTDKPKKIPQGHEIGHGEQRFRRGKDGKGLRRSQRRVK